MTKNVTLKLDASLLRKCRQLAVAQDKSLSQWVTELLQRAVVEEPAYARAKKRALERLNAGFRLGGRPMLREDLHER